MIITNLQLDHIAAFLESLEESIIFKLLDRAQFARNWPAYRLGQSGFAAFPDSTLFELRLRFQEEMDAQFGRFCVPEERPFTKNLPPSARSAAIETRLPIANYELVSQTDFLRSRYLELLDSLCPVGEDGHFGSAVEHDVAALQAVGRRVHFGALFVAEAKFLANPLGLSKLIRQNDRPALLTELTRAEVEARILERVQAKINSIQELINESVRRRVDPEVILRFYRDVIIPATKAGELAYLMAREFQPLCD